MRAILLTFFYCQCVTYNDDTEEHSNINKYIPAADDIKNDNDDDGNASSNQNSILFFNSENAISGKEQRRNKLKSGATIENFPKLSDPLKFKSTIESDVNNSPKGEGYSLSDEVLITMLKQPPKAVAAIRTKSGFQDFFRGVNSKRMQHLLSQAYSHLNELDREQKVKKRMELLDGVLNVAS